VFLLHVEEVEVEVEAVHLETEVVMEAMVEGVLQ
jgi:hypothetical protein